MADIRTLNFIYGFKAFILHCNNVHLLRKNAMTTAIISQLPAGSLRHYLQDVANAGRAFASALFAAQGRQFVAQEVRTTEARSERAKAKDRRQLFSLASQYDGIAPSLSAELRSIAGRG
jgi:hypothetical protein